MDDSRKPLLPFAVGALCGLAAGYFVAQQLTTSPPEPVVPTVDASRAPGASEVVPGLESPPSTRAAALSTASEDRPARAAQPRDEDLLGEALREYARGEIRSGWRSIRPDEIPDDRLALATQEFEKRVLQLPGEIGRRLGEEQSRADRLAEDARRGGAFALLEGMANGTPTPVTDLVSDATAFEALLARGTEESVARGEDSKEELARLKHSGKTFEFGVGCFAVDIGFEHGPDAPSDVTIAGAGMDRTLLVLRNPIFCSGTLRRFSIRDCTVFTNDKYLMDKRGGPATLLLERLRVIGFDMAAGSSCALGFAGSQGLVLLARDCRFEGGYGRSPESGTLFDIRTSAFAARMERCRVDRASLELWRLPAGATIRFDQCTLSDLLDSFARFASPEERLAREQELRDRPGVIIAGSSISFFDNAAHGLGPADWSVPKRDLGQLFPAWRDAVGK